MKLSTAYTRLNKLANSFTPEVVAETVASVAFFGIEHSQVKLTQLTKLREKATTNTSIKTLLQLVVRFTPVKFSKKADGYVFDSDKIQKIKDEFELSVVTQESLTSVIFDYITEKKPESAPKFSVVSDKWVESRIGKFNELATLDQQADEIRRIEAYLASIKREFNSKGVVKNETKTHEHH